MVNPDHKCLIQDAHQAYYRMQMLIDSIRLIHKADDMILDSAELSLQKSMDAIERAIPHGEERGVLRAVEGGKGKAD